MSHFERRTLRVAATIVAVLGLSACATPSTPRADARTARLAIDGKDTAVSYPIDCSQLNWLWTVESFPKDPGFTAIVQTGTAVVARIMRIRDVNGFTGSSAVTGPTDITATIEGTTFTVTGTAHGSFADRPTKPADVQYRLQANC